MPPPFPAGGFQETTADASALTAVTWVGAPGTVTGVTADEADEAGLSPTPLVAAFSSFLRSTAISLRL